MLIPSPRITPADRAVWDRLERQDAVLAQDPRLAVLEDRARAVIRRFAAAGPCYAGTSWGKDSVVTAFLTVTACPQVPLVWVRSDTEPPESCLVRDAFLAVFPAARYEERVFEWRVPLRGEPGWLDEDRPSQDALAEETAGLPRRYISGVRAQESGRRARVMRSLGTASAFTCRPAGWWAAPEVFAFLHARGLPVHPAYAMSRGGVLSRDLIRVHAIGAGEAGTGFGRDLWEDAYYGDVLAARRARLGLPAG